MQTEQINFVPILMQLLLAVGFVTGIIIISGKLGPKRNSANKDKNFECGIESVGNARIPFSVKYFLVAILFVLFDVEIIFMYPWAVNFMGWIKSSSALAVDMFIEMIVFMGLLLAGFIYVIKKGVLTWEK